MNLIRHIQYFNQQKKAFAVTIGNFDGIHLGHQAVIERLQSRATTLNLPSLVILFEPQPSEFFFSAKAPPRLMRLTEKLTALKALGVKNVACLRFNQKLAQMTARDFVKKILCDQLNIKLLIVGDDFRFGKDREGNFENLYELGSNYGFLVEATPTVLMNEQRIGSSVIRKFLANSNFEAAEKLLGHFFSMTGRIIHGQKQGSLMGFPTANLGLHRKVSPVRGIFAVRVYGLSAHTLFGVAYVGASYDKKDTPALLEVHLLNFNSQIYGKKMQVEFIIKIRDDAHFSSLTALQRQIQQDVEAAARFFSKL